MFIAPISATPASPDLINTRAVSSEAGSPVGSGGGGNSAAKATEAQIAVGPEAGAETVCRGLCVLVARDVKAEDRKLYLEV